VIAASQVMVTAIGAAAAGALVVLLAAGARRWMVPARSHRHDTGVGVAHRASRFGALLVRHARLSDDDVACWCDDLARLVRSGSSLAAALRSASAGPALTPILAPIKLALDRGDSVAGATRRVARHGASVGLALGVVRACAELGGPAAQPLDRTAATLRARAADLAERQVHSAQAQLSAIVLTLLPVAALALLLATSAPSRAAVVGPSGMLCLGAGAALNATGWWWMRRIIGRSP
jgi:Flp pilus assembly protein TadB